VNKKWVYPTLLTFLVFFVLSNPETAGPQTRTFFTWVGDQLSSFQTYIDGVFDDTPDAPGVTTPPPATSGADSFSTLAPFGAGAAQPL
jgi:hypothetical protein